MPRVPLVPPELTERPFTVEEAQRFGVERWHLEGSSWKRLGPGVYAWAGLVDSPALTLAAAQLRMPAQAVFSGLTAAWLHGLDTPPCNPVELTVPAKTPTSRLAGLRLRRVALASEDVVTIRGWRATSIERTLADLSAVLTLTEEVVLLDAATHLRRTTPAKLERAVCRTAHRAGIETFRRAIELVEPATESPMESRMRMRIVLAGLPRPVVQKSLYDRSGHLLGRPDLYYPDAKLGLEYDGEVHNTSLAADNRRQNRFLEAGIRLLRFTAGDIYRHPDVMIDQIRSVLSGRSKSTSLP